MDDKKLKFEDAMQRLDVIVRLLEQGDAPLDQSLALFEEGSSLLRQCSSMLDQAEQKVVSTVASKLINKHKKLSYFTMKWDFFYTFVPAILHNDKD